MVLEYLVYFSLIFLFLSENFSSPTYGPKPSLTYYERSFYKEFKSWFIYFQVNLCTTPSPVDPNGQLVGRGKGKIRKSFGFLKIEIIF